MITRRLFTASAVASSVVGAFPALAQSKALTYVGWSQDEAASKPTLSAMFDGYRKANADVKLDVVGFPWGQMQQNILLRLRSGQPLDVVQLAERWLPQFASTGKINDLHEVYGNGALEKLISPGVLKLGDFRGKQLGLPWTAGSIGMVANLKVLKDAGVSAPPKTDKSVGRRSISHTTPRINSWAEIQHYEITPPHPPPARTGFHRLHRHP